MNKPAFIPLPPGWSSAQPLPVTVERDTDGSYLAHEEVFLQHGVGATEEDALRDYYETMTELYEILEESMHPYDAETLTLLKQYIRPTEVTR